MNVTDVHEGEPPDLALVRLLAVLAPTVWTPPTVKNENAAVPHPEEFEEREVRQPIQIGVSSQPTDRGSDTGMTFADVEPAGRSNNSSSAAADPLHLGRSETLAERRSAWERRSGRSCGPRTQ